jgi:WD40 repeat protein
LHKPLHRRGAKGRAVAFAQGGKLLKVSLLDLVSRQVQHSFDVPPYPGRVAFSPSGEAVAVACNEKGAKVWDVASGREILTLKGQGDVVGTVAFSPRGDLVATETSGNPLACGNGPRGNCVPHAAGTREGVNA